MRVRQRPAYAITGVRVQTHIMEWWRQKLMQQTDLSAAITRAQSCRHILPYRTPTAPAIILLSSSSLNGLFLAPSLPSSLTLTAALRLA
eukprot:3427445-Pleurochrysis_carterae.AAC.1